MSYIAIHMLYHWQIGHGLTSDFTIFSLSIPDPCVGRGPDKWFGLFLSNTFPLKDGLNNEIFKLSYRGRYLHEKFNFQNPGRHHSQDTSLQNSQTYAMEPTSALIGGGSCWDRVVVVNPLGTQKDFTFWNLYKSRNQFKEVKLRRHSHALHRALNLRLLSDC